ncbi:MULTISPECIES: LytTR family DNA-binding domain-containing protein [unclassified Clostridioides]|uniref:LytTR family DNA-binding domain-containing protein n=1 Tax=unclassified Clostridioides TaxID=2635829 RepID=UPI001D0F9E85|nr:LytTR family transcriptional regulator [Clostridioides sp. ES-S-0049-03]MCC0675906.1 LytTR family transcriptional regulator [Clostridioides sp. ES-W-0018-02]MCC0711015.1 LytTR family transcriptional regulator [Clostridioides sp. ES-W-0017-02]
MKIHVEQSTNFDDIEIIIKCSTIDNNIEKIISLLNTPLLDINGKKAGEIYKLNICDILYFETVGNKTFAYYKDDVFEVDLKIYELSNRLHNTSFLRISKSMILNMDYLESIKVISHNRMQATLSNNEKVIINRRYIKNIRDKLNI